MIKHMIVLSKSNKNNGYCVAGVSLSPSSANYIRIGHGDNCDELFSRDISVNGKEVELLDKITINVEMLPAGYPQVENYKLIKLVSVDGRITDDEFMDLLDKNQYRDYIFGDTKEYLTFNKGLMTAYSLYFALVTDITLSVEYVPFKHRNRYWCSFRYNGREYKNIRITDGKIQNLLNDLLRCDVHETKILDSFIMFSLPNQNDEKTRELNKFYKLATSFIVKPS